MSTLINAICSTENTYLDISDQHRPAYQQLQRSLRQVLPVLRLDLTTGKLFPNCLGSNACFAAW